MIPGCTHAIDLELDDHTIDLSAYDVYVTIRQGSLAIELSGERVDVSGYNATVYLTQEESLRLRDGANIVIQMNWISTDAITGNISRAASDPAIVPVGVQLLRRLLP